MLEFFLAQPNIPFATAIVFMFFIGLFESLGAIIGLSVGGALESVLPDFDFDTDIDTGEMGSNNALSRVLGWLRVGRVPMLMLLVIALVAFGCIGLLLNLIALSVVGVLLPTIITVPLAFLFCLPTIRVSASLLEKILPKDETSSISLDSLIGRKANVTIGTASNESPAEAKTKDENGQTHYFMVRAEKGHEPLEANASILLVRRDGNEFIAIKAID